MDYSQANLDAQMFIAAGICSAMLTWAIFTVKAAITDLHKYLDGDDEAE